MKTKNIKNIFSVIKKTFGSFGEYKIMKLSASLAYTTIFSIAPLLVMVLFLCSIFLEKEAVEGTIFNQMKAFVGSESAAQVQDMIRSSAKTSIGFVAKFFSVFALLIAATSLFAEIQDSINTIWGVRPIKGAGIKGFFKTRMLSFGVIGSLGFLLLVTLGISTVMDGISERLTQNFSHIAVIAVNVFNLLLTFTIVSILFGVIFKVLPDADIQWKQVTIAAGVTAILFMLGKLLISLYISKTKVGSTFGTAGSLVILLVWVYYSSVILYLGAAFAKQWALAFGTPIRPSKYAETVQLVEVSGNGTTLQHAEKQKDIVINAKEAATAIVVNAHEEKAKIINETKNPEV